MTSTHCPTAGTAACSAPLGKQGNEHLFVLFSRPSEYKQVAHYELPANWVVTLALQPLPQAVILSALQLVTVESRRINLEQLQAEVSAHSDGPVAGALASPAMLARARNSGLVGNRLGYIIASDSRDEVEELLVADVVEERVFYAGRWPDACLVKWLRTIALWSTSPYGFRPNMIDWNELPGLLLTVPLVALTAGAAWLASGLVANTIHATWPKQIHLAVACFAGMLGLACGRATAIQTRTLTKKYGQS